MLYCVRVAALYDIHGNLPALESVMEEVRKIEQLDAIVVGGDILPGPMPHECMDFLMSLDLPVTFIMGNGDREVLARVRGSSPNSSLPKQAQAPIDWTAQWLGSRHEQAMAFWGKKILLEVAGMGEVLFCHATPNSDTENFTRITPEEQLIQIFKDCGTGVVVCGHTHMQFDRKIGKVRVINAGSVGMPFGPPGAYWLVLGPKGAELRRTDYDLELAAARIRDTDYPQANDFAEHYVLHPPTEEAMLALFSGKR